LAKAVQKIRKFEKKKAQETLPILALHHAQPEAVARREMRATDKSTGIIFITSELVDI
jgi:hypothetical protein